METTLYIKNMVCPRCKMAVDQVLRDMQLHPKSVDLGEVHIEEELSEDQLQAVLDSRHNHRGKYASVRHVLRHLLIQEHQDCRCLLDPLLFHHHQFRI